MLQGLPKESLGRRNAPRPTQLELHRVPLVIHSAIQIHQLATNFDERLVGSPAAAHRALEAAPTFFARFSVANDPPQDRRMRDHYTTLTQNLNEISIAEFEPRIPAKAEKNNLVFKPASGKERISCSLPMRHAFIVAYSPPLFICYLHQNRTFCQLREHPAGFCLQLTTYMLDFA
jgi:hypothetical protein